MLIRLCPPAVALWDLAYALMSLLMRQKNCQSSPLAKIAPLTSIGGAPKKKGALRE
jgi:hypothetical protein